MSNAKRVAKLSEFIAHGSNVTCCTIGRKCNRIAATGGEDMKVNLWTLSRPTCIMSLTGHTSTVTNITFSPNEDKIVSGSSSGSIKVWDLEANKLICNLVGHKSDVSCLEYHAYADYVASGSKDSQIRLWDLRRKGCIFTYKGHTEGINSLRFSPDSKWIASASDDKLVKIWDLKAGQLLTNLKGHEAGINSLEFHPNEFLLATGSSDRTVKYWDLEKMEVVSTSPQGLTAISVILFEQNGKCLFASCSDYLLSLTWEPSELHDSSYCQWKNVSDMTTYSNKLLAASCQKNSVSFYAVDLLQVPPIGVFQNDQETARPISVAKPQAVVSNLKGGTINSSRKNFHHAEKLEASEQQDDETSMLQQIQNQKDMVSNSDNSQASIYDQDAYNKIFRHPKESPSTPVEPSAYEPVKKVMHSPPVNVASVASPSHKVVSPVKQSFLPEIYEGPKPGQKLNAKNAAEIDTNLKQLKIDDFMPKPENQARLGAFDFMTTIEGGHNAFMKAIKNRQMNLGMIRSMWTNGNVKSALDTAVSLGDDTVMADILSQLNQTPHIWTMDIATILMPSIKKLIASKYEDHVHVGSESCKIVLKNFGQFIRNNIEKGYSNVGVDITGEERLRKCNSCYSYLVDIMQIIADKTPKTTSNRLLNNFNLISTIMKTLETGPKGPV